jgi:ABC-type nitrate/sulfonate/bicarbonate transport system substrate-binding protein
MLRRGFMAGAGSAGLALTVRPALAQGARPITFVTPFAYILAFVDILYTKAAGYFEREGLDVTIEQGRGSAMALQQVLGGNGLLSRTGGPDHVKASGRPGGDAVIAVGTISQGSPFYVISGPQRPIRKPEDMAGRTVGILSVGGATENLLDVMLVARGVPRDSVKRETVGNSPAGLALIAQGRIDGYIVSAGVPVALAAAKQDFVSWNTDEVAPIPGQVYLARRDALDQNGDLITRFLRAVKRSLDEMLDGKVNVQTVLQKIAPFDVAEARNSQTAPDVLRNEMQFWVTAGRENVLRNVPERWQRGYDLMAAAGFAPSGADVARLYTNRYVEEALR